MMWPLFAYEHISPSTHLWLALLIGMAFGFVLERGGLGHAKKLIGQFSLRDFTVFKVMFTAIITAMLGLFYLRYFGLLNTQLIALPDTYVLAQLLGGLILGAGFALSGYCPGTTVVGMATGKLDALLCFLGLFVGTWLFILLFAWLEPVYNHSHWGAIKLDELWSWQPGSVVAALVVLAVSLFYGLEKWQRST